MAWTPGDMSGLQALTDQDHLYAAHVNELRTAADARVQIGGDIGGTVTSPTSKARTASVTIGPAGSVADIICDGTDDQADFQTAVNSLASTGGIIHVRPGTYFFKGELTLNNSNLILSGAGVGTTTIKATSPFSVSNSSMIDINNDNTATTHVISDIIIENIYFDSNSLSTVHSVKIKGGDYGDGDSTRRVTVRNCKFNNLAVIDVGHITVFSGRGSTDRGSVTDLLIEGCEFRDTAKYHIYISGGQVEGLRIRNCRFVNSNASCIGWNQTNKASNSLASYRSHKNWEISNCYFNNNMLSASFTSLGLINDSNRTGIRGIKIANNFFDGQATTHEQYCIQIHAGWAIEISNNLFWNTRSIMAIGASANGDFWKTVPDNMTKIINNTFYKAYNIADHDSSINALWSGNLFYEIEVGGVPGGTSRQWPSHYINNIVYNTPTTAVGASSAKAAINIGASGHVIRDNTFIDDRLLANPTTAAVLTTVTSGSGHGTRTYYVKYAWSNDTGETLASSESNISLTDTQLLKITHPYSASYGVPTGAKKVNWYVSTSTNTETLQDFNYTSWQAEIETGQPFGSTITWTEPSTGLISGTGLPSANTTHPNAISGVYELSASGLANEIPNHLTNNRIYGTPIPIFKDVDNKRVIRDTFINGCLTGLRVSTDGAMTSGTNTVTSSSAKFTASDVGKTLVIMPFGGASTATTLYTTITGFTSGTQVTVANNAPETYSGAVLAFGTANVISRTGEIELEADPYPQGNITGTTTFDVGNGSIITATLTGNVIGVLSDGHFVGQRLTRIFTMGGSGSYIYTRAANEKLVGSAFIPTTAIGSVDRLTEQWDGTNWNEVSRGQNLG